MKFWIILGALVLMTCLPPIDSQAQMHSDEPVFKATVPAAAIKKSDLKLELATPILKGQSHDAKPLSAARFSRKQFLILGAAVYRAGLADMHQTVKERKYDWWYESDPLAEPLVKLPTSAYYATELALATSLNWNSWKMGHSRRWHKLAAVPQLLAIGGNTYGYATNRFQ